MNSVIIRQRGEPTALLINKPNRDTLRDISPQIKPNRDTKKPNRDTSKNPTLNCHRLVKPNRETAPLQKGVPIKSEVKPNKDISRLSVNVQTVALPRIALAALRFYHCLISPLPGPMPYSVVNLCVC